ncbi:MAG: DALR domain-containing protein, partial [Bacilli bacterium]
NKISKIKEDGVLDKEKYNLYNNRFKEALSDDLNTPNALTVLYDLLKDENVNGITKLQLIRDFDQVLAVSLINEEIIIENEDVILELIAKRNEAKKNKDFDYADEIRNKLLKDGIVLIDTREGTTYKKVD